MTEFQKALASHDVRAPSKRKRAHKTKPQETPTHPILRICNAIDMKILRSGEFYEFREIWAHRTQDASQMKTGHTLITSAIWTIALNYCRKWHGKGRSTFLKVMTASLGSSPPYNYPALPVNLSYDDIPRPEDFVAAAPPSTAQSVAAAPPSTAPSVAAAPPSTAPSVAAPPSTAPSVGTETPSRDRWGIFGWMGRVSPFGSTPSESHSKRKFSPEYDEPTRKRLDLGINTQTAMVQSAATQTEPVETATPRTPSARTTTTPRTPSARTATHHEEAARGCHRGPEKKIFVARPSR